MVNSENLLCTAAPNSGSIARRSPAPSPTTRRKNVQEQTDQMNSRALRRQADTSPHRYNDQYRAGYRQQQQQNRETYGMSSGSSSGSENNRTGSG